MKIPEKKTIFLTELIREFVDVFIYSISKKSQWDPLTLRPEFEDDEVEVVPHSHIALMDEPGNVNLDDNEDEEQLNNPEDVWESFNEVVQEAVANEEMLLLEQEGQVNKGDDKEEDNDGGDEDMLDDMDGDDNAGGAEAAQPKKRRRRFKQLPAEQWGCFTIARRTKDAGDGNLILSFECRCPFPRKK